MFGEVKHLKEIYKVFSENLGNMVLAIVRITDKKIAINNDETFEVIEEIAEKTGKAKNIEYVLVNTDKDREP